MTETPCLIQAESFQLVERTEEKTFSGSLCVTLQMFGSFFGIILQALNCKGGREYPEMKWIIGVVLSDVTTCADVIMLVSSCRCVMSLILKHPDVALSALFCFTWGRCQVVKLRVRVQMGAEVVHDTFLNSLVRYFESFVRKLAIRNL